MLHGEIFVEEFPRGKDRNPAKGFQRNDMLEIACHEDLGVGSHGTLQNAVVRVVLMDDMNGLFGVNGLGMIGQNPKDLSDIAGRKFDFLAKVPGQLFQDEFGQEKVNPAISNDLPNGVQPAAWKAEHGQEDISVADNPEFIGLGRQGFRYLPGCEPPFV